MRRLRNLKLRSKQLIGFGMVLLMMGTLNVYLIRWMQAFQSDIDEVTRNRLPRAVAISDINRRTSDLRILQLQHAFTENDSIKQQQSLVMIDLIDRINENLDTYMTLATESGRQSLYSDEESLLFAAFDEEWETFQDLSLTFFTLTREGENKVAIALLNGEVREVFDSFSNRLEELVELTKRDANEAADRAENAFLRTKRNAYLLLIATVLLSVFLSWSLVRFITIPVQHLESAAREVADGNLDVRVSIHSEDEIGNLATSFVQMTDSLKEAKSSMENQAAKLRERNQELALAMQELRSSQEQLLMKEKMASLGKLVAGLAHEINTPIGTVNSAADVSNRCLQKIERNLQENGTQKRKANGELPKAMKILRDNIKVTEQAGRRIVTLVKSLKNFARLDEAEVQLADIHEGIDSSITLLRGEMQGRVNIERNYGDIPKILCNPGQLNQVFLNLLQNAAHAIRDTGTIQITTTPENGGIRVEISDTGCGIPKEKLTSLFDFGFSAGGSRVKFSSGLSTAYNIVQKHNGKIDVQSEVGEWTRIAITLPLQTV